MLIKVKSERLSLMVRL